MIVQCILMRQSSSLEGIIQLIAVFIMFIFVLALSYFAARLAGRVQTNMNSKSNIHVIESARIANNRYIQVVQIGETYYALGIGKDEITFIGEIPKEELNLNLVNQTPQDNFKEILSQIQKKKDGKYKDEG